MEAVVRAWAIRQKQVQEHWDAGLMDEMKGSLKIANPNRQGAFSPVNIRFDGTEEVEVDGEVKPARIEGLPRAEYIKGWMTETYGQWTSREIEQTMILSRRFQEEAGRLEARTELPATLRRLKAKETQKRLGGANTSGISRHEKLHPRRAKGVPIPDD